MSKKQPERTVADDYIELRKLLVERSAEKTDRHDKRIEELKANINFFEYGINDKSARICL